MENATATLAKHAHLLLPLAFALAVCPHLVYLLTQIHQMLTSFLFRLCKTENSPYPHWHSRRTQGIPCNPADVRFVGKPVDFVGFPGAAEGKPIREVLIIEVKSGTSRLSERERQIKAAVESGRVRYMEYRI